MSEPSDLSSKQAQRAQVYFQKGGEAMQKNNLDYAIDMFREALKLVPENILYRQALRGVERRKFGNDPSKVGRLVGARLQSARLGVKATKAKGKWMEVLDACEDIFKHDPWHVGAAQDAADAAEHLGYLPLAKWLMESVHAQAENDAHFLRHLGQIYELNQDYDRAIACWEKVKQLVPNDQDALRKMKGLAADATISRSKLDEAVHRPSEGPSGPVGAAEAALDELKRDSMNPEERLRKAIEDEPERVSAYLDLADYYKQHNQLDEAERVLHRGKKLMPHDEILASAHAEIQMNRLSRAVGVYTKRVRDNPDDPELQEKLKKYQETLNEYELKEFRRRVTRQPEDLKLHFELGLRLFRLERYDEAIAEFQQARNLPALKVQALFHAGMCFEAKELPKLAERNYAEALKLIDPDDSELFNALHYRLGRAAEAHGDIQVAEEHYNEVAANDYTYEDVAQRLRNLNQRR
jgi:tetratricopeptide (TPR) repeat protein